jgi:nitrate/nitrite transporter NarK
MLVPARRKKSIAAPSRAVAHDSVGLVILWSAVASAGVGAAFASIPNLIVAAVDERQTGEATGVNTVMRNVGSAVGAQVAGAIIATNVLANGLPDSASVEIAFLISAIGAVIAALSVLLIPGRQSPRSAAEPSRRAPVKGIAPPARPSTVSTGT